MHSKPYHLSMLLIFLLSTMVNAQEKFSESEQWINIDKDLIYNIVIATDIDQNIIKGLLYGMKGDSIYLSLNKKMISLDVKNLITLSIENRRTSNLGAVSGALSGMYLGSLLLLTSQNQPAKYLVSEEGSILPPLYELLFVTVGGGIGYLIDRSSRDGQEVFYFTLGEEATAKEIKKLKNFLTHNYSAKKLHINIHLSQVSTRYSEVLDKNSNNNYGANGYYYSNDYGLHSFNLLRKLSVTYEFIEKLEIGFAFSWFGEPNIGLFKNESHYDPNNYYSTSANVTQSFDGLGYYLVLNYKPLKNTLPDNFDLIIGGGIGFGKVDFSFRSETITTQNYPAEPVNEIKESIIDKVIFSSLFAGEIKYYIYPELSLSLQADYIYLPEKMPAVPAFGYEERNLGNFSFGLGLGVNF